MNKNIIISLGIAVLISTKLFALSGSHAGLRQNLGGDNNQICVYCHTPHASNVAFGKAPLWNKPLTSTVFTMYGASSAGVAGQTMAGTATDAQPTDAALACLSCHDGVSAMNSVINAPGSGRISSTGVLIGSNPPSPEPMTNLVKAMGYNGDMTDDHPISIVYNEGRAGLRPKTTPLVDFFGATTVGNLLRNGKVQCVSCHDPHGTGWSMYLRNGNTGSTLCLGCHNK